MANVYSTAFIGEKELSGSAVYTVPTGYVAVVRDCDVFQGSSSTGVYFQLLGGEGQAFFWCSSLPLTAQWFQWTGRHVLNEGATLTALVGSGNPDVSVSGYLLSLP